MATMAFDTSWTADTASSNLSLTDHNALLFEPDSALFFCLICQTKQHCRSTNVAETIPDNGGNYLVFPDNRPVLCGVV